MKLVDDGGGGGERGGLAVQCILPEHSSGTRTKHKLAYLYTHLRSRARAHTHIVHKLLPSGILEGIFGARGGTTDKAVRSSHEEGDAVVGLPVCASACRSKRGGGGALCGTPMGWW